MAVTVSEARRRLFPLVKQVVDDRTPVEITSKDGAVVMMAAEDFSAWKETAYLLSNPANAERLRRSHANALAGDTEEHALDLS